MGVRTPPFPGVVGSRHFRGVNVGSRVVRDGFTGTRRVLVSAFPSAGVGYPTSCLGVRGSRRVFMQARPGGEVDRGVVVAVAAEPATAGEHPIRQGQLGLHGLAGRAAFTRRVPAVGGDDGAARIACSAIVVRSRPTRHRRSRAPDADCQACPPRAGPRQRAGRGF